ncbi:unnamed protein product [Pylaiella littoralis]
MSRAVVLLGVLSALYGSQAFFLAPPPATTTPARRSSSSTTCRGGATGAGWSCQYDRGVYSSTGRRERRGTAAAAAAGGGALEMTARNKRGKKVKDRLEEVPDELASMPVELACPKTGKTLMCYAERIAVVGGERYLVAFPKDPAVAIAFDESGEVSPVPNDDPIMDELFPLAEACAADLGPGVTLLRTPTTLTVRGLNELVETVEDSKDGGEDGGESFGSIETGGGGGGGGGAEEEEEEEEADEVELLGEFLLEGEEFLMVRFLEPILILAKEREPGKYVLIDEEEEQDAIPLVDEMLCADPAL